MPRWLHLKKIEKKEVFSTLSIFDFSYYLRVLEEVFVNFHRTEIFAFEFCLLSYRVVFSGCERRKSKLGKVPQQYFPGKCFSIWSAYSKRKFEKYLIKSSISRALSQGGINEVTVMWVPGYSGIQQNETPDRLAREETRTRPNGPKTFLPLSLNRFKAKMVEYFNSAHIHVMRMLWELSIQWCIDKYRYFPLHENWKNIGRK